MLTQRKDSIYLGTIDIFLTVLPVLEWGSIFYNLKLGNNGNTRVLFTSIPTKSLWALYRVVNPLIVNPTKWSNNADELFECVWEFCGVGA